MAGQSICSMNKALRSVSARGEIAMRRVLMF
jgi:hypothetical protein